MSGRDKGLGYSPWKKSSLVSWLLFFLSGYVLQAQDLPYTLYHFTPLNINPALVAAGNSLEANYIFRHRPAGSADGFRTFQMSLTHPLLSSGRKWGGIGLQVVGGSPGESSSSNRPKVTAALAYHLTLSPRQILSIGFSGSFGPNGNASEGERPRENLRSPDQTSFKLNSGLYYRGTDKAGRETFYLSLALIQAIRPEENFTFYNKVPSTFLLSGGFRVWQNDLLAVESQILWNNRAGHNYVQMGGNVKYSLDRLQTRLASRKGSIEAGVSYGNAKALVLTLVLLQPLYHLGISYDLPLSPYAEGNLFRKGPEVALRVFPAAALQLFKASESNRKEKKVHRKKKSPFLPDRLSPANPAGQADPQEEENLLSAEDEQDVFREPAWKGKGSAGDEASFQNRPLHFDLNQNAVEAEEEKIFLQDMVEFLQQHPEITVRIVGHTDDTGPDETNIKLSFRRAQVIADFLLDKGIQGERVVVEGHGSFNPLVPNSSAENRARNRRVEIILGDAAAE
jgi:type IX secretion system PorP/SprF family membrane protein